MKPTNALAVVACIALLAVATPAVAASGDLDASFSGDGVFTWGLANPAEEGAAGVAVDPSGKLLVGNYNYPSNMAVSRVLPGGGLDGSFAGGTAQLADGKVRLTNAVGVQPDGKPLVAGNLGTAGQNVFLTRYRNNGNADGSFGSGGLAHVKMCGTSAYETNVVVRSDGSIAVVGDCGNGSDNDRLFVLVFKPGGGLDRTFSGDGTYMLQIGDDTWVRDATLDGRDRLTIVGQSRTGTGHWRAMAVRLTPRGVPDASFSGDGKATFDFAAGDDDPRAVTGRNGGALIAEQAVAGDGSSDMLLFALTTQGKLDTTFSGDGKARIDIVTQDNPADITTDASGRIYLAATYTWPPTEASVLRRKANGAVDTSFAGGGITHAGVKSVAGSITMWKGKPTVVGFADLTTDFDALVARFLP